ncbi:hypothetical protein [Sphingomonas jatrophae]|uniref:DUF429 domain-containing protein n=1 Tax=Sphingomonas jatrophae TaxID=1166337 RepID=A0A1I6K9N8_9SPHN|nr:hypothetical protein [Sphingomonas jatrophae]SFR87907.1 hypothetical protein SAMN05192580_1478 [Sphingomonas jatrophae]
MSAEPGVPAGRFTRFMGIDWSGAAVERPPGLAVAEAEAGRGPPHLIRQDRGWSREDVLARLRMAAETGEALLIGIDFSPALPFADRGAYFPGEAWSPPDARSLWALVDAICRGDAHLAATALPRHAAAHFRRQEGRTVLTGDAFEQPSGRLRVVEAETRRRRLGNATSGFNLIGAAQVGRASLTGMRLLHRLAGRVPIWPFDPVPPQGPLIVEVYSAIAAVAAGMVPGRTKLRDATALDGALAALGSAPAAPLPRYDDHSTDAMLIAAWLRRVHTSAALWRPALLDDTLARTEGWTFGLD